MDLKKGFHVLERVKNGWIVAYKAISASKINRK